MHFLKKRAREFYERAFEDIDKTRYNLAILDFEQALQLYLKYLIGIKAGDYPKIHYLTELLKTVIQIYNLDELKVFYQKNRLVLKMLEDAYITSRYFPKEFEYEEVEDVKETILALLKVLENGTGKKFI